MTPLPVEKAEINSALIKSDDKGIETFGSLQRICFMS
jgi:hypothetical protein